jgi:hypothetical protein
VRKPQPEYFKVVTFKDFPVTVQVKGVSGSFFKQKHGYGPDNEFGYLIIPPLSVVGKLP